MYEPFPGNYVWNLSINIALGIGGVMGEIDEANRPVREAALAGADAGTSAFFASWCALADRLVAQARADEAQGHLLSASHKHHRACVYYMIAERMEKQGFAPRNAAYAKMLAAMADAVRTGGLDVERVEIAYEGSSYPALFVPAKSRDGRAAPCMVHTNGLDSIKEMIFWSGIGDALADRGVSTLMVDHPGVG